MPRSLVLVSAWGGCALFGLWTLLVYEQTPGAAPLAKSAWPSETKLTLHSQVPTLLVFFHPQCPCSRASLAELQKLATSCPERFALELVFVMPPGAQASWAQSHLVSAARGVPQASICLDWEGIEAVRFDAATSGEARLYSEHGRLLFHGGVTASRGHEGDNLNAERLRALIEGETTAAQIAPVYGCPLLN